jgi:serine/threonine protein phosphatase PrpC
MTYLPNPQEVQDDDGDVATCSVCDGVGHSGGEFGELCLANGRSWFEPSDPRDLDGHFDDGARDGDDPTVWW